MKKFLLKLLTATFTLNAFAALTEVDKSLYTERNLLPNPGFENGKSTWSSVTSTFGITTTAANVLTGVSSASWLSTATNGYLRSKTVYAHNGMLNQNCEARIRYKGGDAFTALEVYDRDNNLLGTSAVAAKSTPGTVSVFFTCPTVAGVAGDADSQYLYLQVKQTSAGTAVTYFIDDAYIGLDSRTTLTSTITATKSSNYTIASGDQKIPVTSASAWNLTLPSAATMSGQTVEIFNIDASITGNAISIVGSIIGPKGAESDWKIHTPGEVYQIYSNGTSYYLLKHQTRTGLLGTATITLTASTSGTFTPGTTTAKTIDGYRVGRNIVAVIDYRQTAAGSNGTGNILITIPYSLSADTNGGTGGGPVYTGTDPSTAHGFQLQGHVSGNAGASVAVNGFGYLYDATRFAISGSFGGALGIWGSSTLGLLNTTTNVKGEVVIPISGWKD